MPGPAAVAPPQLGGHPLVGALPTFRRNRVELLDALAATPGDVVGMRLGRRAYLLKRPEDVQHVLVARHAEYPKGPRNVGSRAKRVFGPGLFTSTAEGHRRMRVRSQPAFRRDPIARLEKGIVRAVDAMLDRWSRSGELDLGDEMGALSMQAVIGATFGEEAAGDLPTFQRGMMARRHAMGRAFAWPVTAPGFLPLAFRRDERRAIADLDATVRRLIRERRDRPASSDDLLSMLMETHASGRQEADVKKIHGEVLNLALAADVNIARALTYTMAALVRHPEVEARVRAEVDEVLGDRPPDEGERPRLRYTEMTLAESLRLWPPNTLIFRVAREDDVLPTGYRIPAGSKVVLSPYVVQRDPRYFPDPERFDPERFSEDGRRGRPKYAYFPFGGGPRVCIGQTLSTTICTLAIVRIVQRARLNLDGLPAYACGCPQRGVGPRMHVQSLVPSLA